MRNVKINVEQRIINKINAKQNFKCKTNKIAKYPLRLYIGYNPSQQYTDIYSDVYKYIKDGYILKGVLLSNNLYEVVVYINTIKK